MVCFSDGIVVYIEFNKDEIGDLMVQNDVVSRFFKDGCYLYFEVLFYQSFVNILFCMDIKVINFNVYYIGQRISMDMFFIEFIKIEYSNKVIKMWYKLIFEYLNRCKFLCLY